MLMAAVLLVGAVSCQTKPKADSETALDSAQVMTAQSDSASTAVDSTLDMRADTVNQ